MMLLASLVTINAMSAQTPPKHVTPPESAKSPLPATEIAVSGWVKQIQSACLTCTTPEVRFCLITEPSATSCGTYFVYRNSAKDEVGSNYTALLTALGSDKSVLVYSPNPSSPFEGAVVEAQAQAQFRPGTEKNPLLVNRILILAPDQPPPASGIPKPNQYAYVVSVQIIDSHLRIAVNGNFSKDHFACGDHQMVRSARPISDPETQAMESVALASFLGNKRVVVWVAGCLENDGIMTAINIMHD
jgi:hypothetical protein